VAIIKLNAQQSKENEGKSLPKSGHRVKCEANPFDFTQGRRFGNGVVSVFVSFLRGLVYNLGRLFRLRIVWLFRIGDKACKIIVRVWLRGIARADF